MISSLPVLFVAQSVTTLLAARTTDRRIGSQTKSVAAVLPLIAAIALWGGVDVVLASQGVYFTERFLALLPGLWLPFVPPVILGLATLCPRVRRGLKDLIVGAPRHWLVGIQALRGVAITTPAAIVYAHFKVDPAIWLVELSIGLSDAVFGLSALLLYRPVRRAGISPDAMVVWHATGILLILVPGLFAIQMGLPGPFQIPELVSDPPAMLTLPTVLAPSLVVPCFMLLNALGIGSALMDQASKAKQTD